MEVSIKYRKRLSCLSSQGAIKAEHAAAFENKTKQTETKHTEITILLYILFIRFTFHMPLC